MSNTVENEAHTHQYQKLIGGKQCVECGLQVVEVVPQPNATFYCFKPSGKWYSNERGVLLATNRSYEYPTTAEVCEANGGHWPGLSTDGSGFVRIVIPDDGVPYMIPVGK